MIGTALNKEPCPDCGKSLEDSEVAGMWATITEPGDEFGAVVECLDTQCPHCGGFVRMDIVTKRSDPKYLETKKRLKQSYASYWVDKPTKTE